MDRAVVIGSSPAALRAAAILAERGVAVRYLGTAARAAGVAPEPPWGRGAADVEGSEDGATLARVWGRVQPLDAAVATRGVLVEGRVLPIPLRRRDLVRLLGPGDGARAAAGLVQARLRVRMGNVLDLGREVRSYADWVRDRLGDGFFETMHGPYARKRYGIGADELAPWVGWWTHSRAGGTRWLAPSDGAAAAEERQRERILAAGGEVLEGVAIEGMEVADGRLAAVLTDVGREHVERIAFVDVPPRTLGRWLPEDLVDEAWRFDLERLESRHAVQVTLPVDGADALPWELHVVDARRPFWRLTRPGLLPGEERWKGHVTAHLTLDGADPLWGDEAALVEAVRAGLDGLVRPGAGSSTVQRIPDAVPTLRLTSQPSLIRRLDACDRLGIVGIGSRGAFRPMEVVDELHLVESVLDADTPSDRVTWQREAHRQLLERPVKLPPKASPWAVVAD